MGSSENEKADEEPRNNTSPYNKVNPSAPFHKEKTKENPNDDQPFQGKKDPIDKKGAPDIDKEATAYIEKIHKQFEDAQRKESEQANVLDEQPGKEKNEEADREPRYHTSRYKVNPSASFHKEKTKENPNDESFQEKKDPSDEKGDPDIDRKATAYIEETHQRFDDEVKNEA